jgi:hypothetical protein
MNIKEITQFYTIEQKSIKDISDITGLGQMVIYNQLKNWITCMEVKPLNKN